MNIIAQTDYAQSLTLGQHYEQWLCDHLATYGLEAYRPQQHFIPASNHWCNRQDGKCRLSKNRFPESAQFDPSLLRPFQRDVLVKVGTVKRLSVEVKALTPAAFARPFIHIGDTRKWDEKQFPIAAIVLINQQTLECWTVPGSPSEWLRMASLNSDSYDYAVDRRMLSPLEAWVSYIKDSYGLG
jgi:hypothetical protein